jgi:hypothetical protein
MDKSLNNTNIMGCAPYPCRSELGSTTWTVVSEHSQGKILELHPKVLKPDRSDLRSSQACCCQCRRLVAAVRFTSRIRMFTQLVIKAYLSNLKIIFTDCVVVAVPVNLNLCPPSPLTGDGGPILSLTGEQRTKYALLFGMVALLLSLSLMPPIVF